MKGPEVASFGVNSTGGVIVITTKRGKENKPIPSPHVKTLSPLGYQQPVEFYAPKYDTPGKRNAAGADFRTTIHWQPVVQINSEGKAAFEFYTADEQTSYTVIIEGISVDGRIIRMERKLWQQLFQ